VWSLKRWATTRSMTCEMKGRLQIGRYEEMVSGSRVDFFNRGVSTACLREEKRVPDYNDKLHRLQMTGASWLDSCLRSHKGMRFDKQDLVGDETKTIGFQKR
jgi:hypothetical protein